MNLDGINANRQNKNNGNDEILSYNNGNDELSYNDGDDVFLAYDNGDGDDVNDISERLDGSTGSSHVARRSFHKHLDYDMIGLD